MSNSRRDFLKAAGVAGSAAAFHASIGRANSDSSSFVAKKIPAVTIHGLNKDWSTILHSKHDQVAKVNAASVYLGYRLALAMIVKLDASACDAYRQ